MIIFHIAQTLTGQKCFQAYHFKIKEVGDPEMFHILYDWDYTENALLECAPYQDTRASEKKPFF